MPFIFQHILLENPRAPYSELGRGIGCSRHTAKDHLNELYKKKILFHPQWRLLMSNQISEYVYLLKVDDPDSFSYFLEEEKNVLHYCLLAGPFNLIFYSYSPVDLSHLTGYEQTILSGIRSNFHVPPVPNTSYETAYSEISKRCEIKIEPSLIDMTVRNTAWTEELWNLFTDLKYSLDMDFTSLVKKYGFKKTTFYERLKQISLFTDIFVPLYPLGESEYLSFCFLFKTRYQKFVVDSFGKLPVSSFHLRIKDSLLSYVFVPHGREKEHIRNIIVLWKRKGIIDAYDFSIPYSSASPHPGIPFPPPHPPPSPRGTTPLDKGEGSVGKMYR